MADMSKAEKLAAARRKLKEFQQKTKESTANPVKDVIKKEIDKLPSSEIKDHIEENSVFDCGPIAVNHVFKESAESEEEVSLKNHVNLSEENFLPLLTPENVFPSTLTLENSIKNDVFISNGGEITADNKPLDVFFGNIELKSKPLFSDDLKQSNFFEQYSSSKPDVLPNNPLSNMFAANEFFDNISNFTPTNVAEQPNIDTSTETDKETFPSSVQLFQADETQCNTVQGNDAENHDHSVVTQGPVTETQLNTDDTAQQTAGEIRPACLAAAEAVVNHSRSSTESLRQLSHQINDLINESQEVVSLRGESHELECRNQELAAMLSTERQKSEQLRQQLKECQSRTSQLQLEMDELRTECDARLAREVGPLQEQLQLHVQTVGLLVGEKTELQAALSKSQQTAKQKAAENEEMQGRLKLLRQQMADLEKEVTIKSENSKQQEKMNSDLLLEVDRIKVEQKLLKKQMEETEEETSELRQRLQSKTSECAALREDCQEKQSQLALTQLRVQQLSMPDSPETSGQLESLHQQNVSLERQLAELQQVVRTSATERDQSSQQYQHYVQQLNSQLHSIAAKLEAVTAENEQLVGREQNLVRHISELEKQLQQQQQVQRKQEPQSSGDGVRELEERLSAVETEKRELASTLEAQVEEILALKGELEERSLKLDEVNLKVEKFQSSQPDKEKLLAAMESDKVAAARAVGQNQQLKQQLEELQEGFVRVSNNKLELTEKLQYEQHISKELGERLTQQESELEELRNLLEKKDQQIESLEQNSRELSTQVLQHHQIADRMRHYEAQGHFSDLLQQEHAKAKEHIEKLTAQITELQQSLAQKDAISSDSVSSSPDDESHRKDAVLATLSASVNQLELERNQLLEQLKELQIKSAALNDNPGVADNETLAKEYETMKQAMEQLEERFANKMRDVAELSDEKQRLEHLVLQLQGETETIGEYIALYQVQRSILRQRAREKDEQLSKLAEDREELKTKLDSLNNLVQELLTDKEQRMHSDMPLVHLQGIPNGVVTESEAVPVTEVPKQAGSEALHKDPASVEKGTAQKIIELLTEIKSSNLVEPQCSENFHPCPWCSGQLINV